MAGQRRAPNRTLCRSIPCEISNVCWCCRMYRVSQTKVVHFLQHIYRRGGWRTNDVCVRLCRVVLVIERAWPHRCTVVSTSTVRVVC